MTKLQAVAILAMATFSGCASVQADTECAALEMETGQEESRCFGPEEADVKTCCEGQSCFQQIESYAQCRPTNGTVPDGWDGNIIEPGEPAVSTNTTAAGNDTAEGNATVIFEYMAYEMKDYLPANATKTRLVMIEVRSLTRSAALAFFSCNNVALQL